MVRNGVGHRPEKKTRPILFLTDIVGKSVNGFSIVLAGAQL